MWPFSRKSQAVQPEPTVTSLALRLGTSIQNHGDSWSFVEPCDFSISWRVLKHSSGIKVYVHIEGRDIDLEVPTHHRFNKADRSFLRQRIDALTDIRVGQMLLPPVEPRKKETKK